MVEFIETSLAELDEPVDRMIAVYAGSCILRTGKTAKSDSRRRAIGSDGHLDSVAVGVQDDAFIVAVPGDSRSIHHLGWKARVLPQRASQFINTLFWIAHFETAK